MNSEKVGNICGVIFLILYVASKTFKKYEALLTDLIINFLLVLLLVYGIYSTISVIRNWESFRKAYKPMVDLTSLFGDFGRIVYMLLGMVMVAMSVLLFCVRYKIGPYKE